MSDIIAVACPPRCDAGGPSEDDGHDFSESKVLEWYEAGWSKLRPGVWLPRRPAMESLVCSKCGLSAMDRDLLRLP